MAIPVKYASKHSIYIAIVSPNPAVSQAVYCHQGRTTAKTLNPHPLTNQKNPFLSPLKTSKKETVLSYFTDGVQLRQNCKATTKRQLICHY